MQQEVKIPKDRIAVLIGENGKEKTKIQKLTKTKLKVNSKEGDVIVEGEDSFNVFVATNIVKAVARGINPKYAMDLAKENYILEIVNIQDFSGKSKRDEERIKARIIGTKGKARRHLEYLTNTHISVYGKTVSIIGEADDCLNAKKAVQKILQGAPHSHAYRLIEDSKKRHSEENF